MNPVPFEFLFGDDIRFIGLDFYLDLEFVGRFFAPVREITTVGTPLVSWAYNTAAEIPIPCCPRV